MQRVAKPWYRARNVTFAILALVAGLAGWSIFRALSATPGPTIDYGEKLRALSLSRQPGEGADAYPTFEKVLAIVHKAQERVKADAGEAPGDLPQGSGWPVDYSMLGDPQVHPTVYQASLAAIEYANQDGLFAELDNLAAAPRAVWPKPSSPLFENLFPGLGQSRNLARMGAARMDLAAARGDWDEFARAFEHTLGVSRVCDAQGFLISKLVSIAIDSLALDRARSILATAAVPEATLARLLRAMDSSARAPFADSIEAERLGMMDVIQNVFTDDGRGDGMIILSKFRTMTGEAPPAGPGSWRIINVAGLLLPGKEATTAKCDELFDGITSYAAAAPGARSALDFQPDRWVDELPRKFAPLKVLAPAFGRAVGARDQHASLWEGTRVMLGVEIYKRRHGQYPESLAQLVPAILKEIPADPFNPGGYRYARLAPGEDAMGAGYTLYSVGADGKDEKGVEGQQPHSAYDSRSPSGDFRFNAPK